MDPELIFCVGPRSLPLSLAVCCLASTVVRKIGTNKSQVCSFTRAPGTPPSLCSFHLQVQTLVTTGRKCHLSHFLSFVFLILRFYSCFLHVLSERSSTSSVSAHSLLEPLPVAEQPPVNTSDGRSVSLCPEYLCFMTIITKEV